VQVVLRGAVQLLLEIGRHLEQLAEFGVEVVEQVVQQPIPEQDHLHVERDSLRLQRDGADRELGFGIRGHKNVL